MKRRNRKGYQRFASFGRKATVPIIKRVERKRKSWSFEHLEDRLVFSIAPLNLITYSFSSDNPVGAAQTLADEANWAQMATATASGQSVDSSAIDPSSPQYFLKSLPTDPLFANADPNQPYTQWHLLNTGQEVGEPDLQNLFGVAGQDIDVVPAWNMLDPNGNPINGSGITVAVIDTGVQIGHPDLAANISPTLRYNSTNGSNNVTPSLVSTDGGHGTSVAGIIGAVADNGIGGVGVAPGVTLVPIRASFTNGNTEGLSEDSIAKALLYALQHNVDITSNSYGPPGRTAIPFSDFLFDPITNQQLPTLPELLRDSVINGRPGIDANGNPADLGMINVFASGNDAGPQHSVGFPSVGNWSSSSYNPFVNSRYTIGVTGVDHDGLYANADGTFTDYPEVSASVLVAAPTGSNILGVNNIGNDDGFGSGITTTDLVGDAGFNAAALPSGFDPDRDFLADPNYTSRFNGTSASTPMVSGVIALMLQANPHLTYRDVEEILVRSSRQNAQFENPTSGGIGAGSPEKNTWQTNQTGPFRNPDTFGAPEFDGSNFDAFAFPVADPNVDVAFHVVGGGFNNFTNFYAPTTNDESRQEGSNYEPEPPMYTNGAGYTVSQGYGVYGEQIGYAHGVVDAAAAVAMAKQWDTLGQNIDPNTELTYTSGVISIGNLHIPAAEKIPDDHGGFLIPGGIGGVPGFGAFWDQYFATPPFVNYTGKIDDDRGLSYIDFQVPPAQEMNVEWAEVKVDLSTAAPMDGLRIMLVSPEGTQSELTNDYIPTSWTPFSSQPSSHPAQNWSIDPGGTYGLTGGDFVWTFSTNRSWGESSNSEVLIHPLTGEPILQNVLTQDLNNGGLPQFSDQPIFRNWELHIENWSATPVNLLGLEVVWHGKPIAGGSLDPNYAANGIQSAQRVQGFVGIDTNGDGQFNYNRYVQTLLDFNGTGHTDVSTVRDGEVSRTLDFTDNNHNGIYDAGDTINQEPFAANVIVDAYKVWNGVPESTPTARFLTGADGNYYFDLDPVGDMAQTLNPASPHFGQTIQYQIRATDQITYDNASLRPFLDDITTPGLSTDPNFTYLPHYKSVWTINPNWFFAADHDNPAAPQDNPGEVFFDPSGNAGDIQGLVNPTDLPEPGLPSPVAWSNNGTLDHIIPAPVKNLNFLLKAEPQSDTFNVTGAVYSDVNGDGQFNGTDAPAAGVKVYWDENRDKVHQVGEPEVLTDASGNYVLPIDLSTLSPIPTAGATYQIGVEKPAANWTFTDPGRDGVESVFAGPGSADQTNVNFFIKPPSDQSPDGTGPGTIQGIVFNDLNGNKVQDVGETGVPNFRVFIDLNQNGVWDSATEPSVVTAPGTPGNPSNGSFFFANVSPGVYRIDVVIPNENTPAAAWALTSPISGFQDVQLLAGGSVTGVAFGLKNLADSDWGDLPSSYVTTSTDTDPVTGLHGPSHLITPGFQLGATVDGEVNGQPSLGANADDSDDGVVVVSNGGVLKTGVNTLQVTVFGVGGYLTGWMDFNNDGHFDESERLDWSLNGTDLTGEADLNPGTYNLQITIPANAVDGRPIASRFRWGEQGLTFDGPSQIGEVEDYFFGLDYLAGDYNRNGIVDQADFVVWQKSNGHSVTPYSGADGNGDGMVNQADFDIWKAHFGQMLPPPGAGSMVATASEVTDPNASGSAGTSTIDYSALLNRSSSSTSSPSYGVLQAGAATPQTGASSTQDMAMLAAQQTDATSGTATAVASDSSVSGSSPFSPFVAVAGQSASFASSDASVANTSTADGNSSNSDLLLLDETWASIDDHSYAHDESLYSDQSHETTSTSDLALAAVLNEDDNQWNTI